MLTKYKTMIGFIAVFSPDWCFAIAADTSTKTRIGATALRALTNKVPKVGIIEVSSGYTYATRIPSSKPMMI